ncbi:MAG: hypothetical protein QME81_20925, partial [bacterium]|nr:hypothetical protein [bacterium]
TYNTMTDRLIINDGASTVNVGFINSNVGIGTTGPAQKLHVEGQCVTGDTELAIFEVQGSRFKVQGIPIKDTKPGMMVYSLNEELGLIEPHRILALLDMGIKPVFKLTTKDGKAIKTTGNHPYLVVKQGGLDREEVAARRIRSLADEHGVSGQSLRLDRDISQGRALW